MDFCLGCHSDTVSQKICGMKKSYGSCAACDELPCSALKEKSDDNSDNPNNLKQLSIKYKKAE